MADGPLSQIAQPDLPQSAGNPAMQLLNAYMQRVQGAPKQMEDLDKQRADALLDYQAKVREAGRLDPMEAFLRGFSSYGKTYSPAGMAQAGIDAMNAQYDKNRATEAGVSELGYKDVTERQKMLSELMGGAGGATQMLHAALNPIQNIGGVGVNRGTGEVIRPKDYADLHERAFQAALKPLLEARDPDAWNKANSMADQYLRSIGGDPATVGGVVKAGTTTPDRVAGGALPPQPGQASAKPAMVDSRINVPEMTSQLRTQMETAARTGDFNKARELQKALMAILNPAQQVSPEVADAQIAKPPAAAPAPAGQFDYLDPRREASEKETGTGQAKDLIKHYSDLSQLGSESANMLRELNILTKLDANPNMPQGEYAGLLQKIRSGMSTVGIDTGDATAAADIYNAIASNMALKIRTAGGTNLLPGAMSNYEDQLLQKMSPVLSQTKEGRAALRQIMQDVAETNMRIATEAHKLASSNRGALTPEWYARRARVEKEELVRMMQRSNETLKKFGIQGAQ